MWEYYQNQECDRQNETKTFVMHKGELKWWFDLLFECCFSPLEGSCIGFEQNDEKIVPILKEIQITDCIRNDTFIIQSSALSLIKKFRDLFDNYLEYFQINDISPFLSMLKYFMGADLIAGEQKNNISLLKNLNLATSPTLDKRVLDSNYSELMQYKGKSLFILRRKIIAKIKKLIF